MCYSSLSLSRCSTPGAFRFFRCRPFLWLYCCFARCSSPGTFGFFRLSPASPYPAPAYRCFLDFSLWNRCNLSIYLSCPRLPWGAGGGIGGGTAAILPGLKLYNSFPFLHRYVTLMGGSHHLISQAGWNRCNLSIYLSLLTSMDNTKVTMYHLISQAGWNRCNLSISLSIYLS